ncbi:uncharacterized protein LTR77_005161 [Saxophila tyrrhenica]|uniref:Uncharacterized protein n=1 Tax=Saxophila tyrrhenica TaxID=1690608 RepID=A0AAV9PFG1_9PEZI|nr:hypothetical protein LTR77_005161 [Saxophila tyrrhenica]
MTSQISHEDDVHVHEIERHHSSKSTENATPDSKPSTQLWVFPWPMPPASNTPKSNSPLPEGYTRRNIRWMPKPKRPASEPASPAPRSCGVVHRHYCPAKLVVKYVFFDQKVAKRFAHVHFGMKLERKKTGGGGVAMGDLNELKNCKEGRAKRCQRKFGDMREPEVGGEVREDIFSVMES